MKSLLHLLSLAWKRLRPAKPEQPGQPVTITGLHGQLNGQWQALAIEQDSKGMIRLRLDRPAN